MHNPTQFSQARERGGGFTRAELCQKGSENGICSPNETLTQTENYQGAKTTRSNNKRPEAQRSTSSSIQILPETSEIGSTSRFSVSDMPKGTIWSGTR